LTRDARWDDPYINRASDKTTYYAVKNPCLLEGPDGTELSAKVGATLCLTDQLGAVTHLPKWQEAIQNGWVMSSQPVSYTAVRACEVEVNITKISLAAGDTIKFHTTLSEEGMLRTRPFLKHALLEGSLLSTEKYNEVKDKIKRAEEAPPTPQPSEESLKEVPGGKSIQFESSLGIRFSPAINTPEMKELLASEFKRIALEREAEKEAPPQKQKHLVTQVREALDRIPFGSETPKEATDYLGIPGLLGLVSLSLFNQKAKSKDPRKRVDQDEPLEAQTDLEATEDISQCESFRTL
jgi:hypothetical protein